MLRTVLLGSFVPALTLGVLATPCAAEDAPSHDGHWRGVVTASIQNTVRLDATIDRQRASLHFGEPANCKIVADHLRDADGSSFYRFHPSTNGGGFCARLYPGELMVNTPAPRSIAMAFQRAESRWAGVLKRADSTKE
ncbi:hypothetical protein C8J98_101347 [Luteibacter sp. OK325]|uniref:hypothetical protein n=1 Tax=Luteibacter sp. OK325 TaxID=2135670 RepID=UPI000D368FB1|nr:hypothetical protein [Luteibacter sp. OK325]PTR35085.1 hypothetical protein C8J98_101347 [Luteibacter sp. OK325]